MEGAACCTVRPMSARSPRAGWLFACDWDRQARDRMDAVAGVARFDQMHPLQPDSPPRFLFFATITSHLPFGPA